MLRLLVLLGIKSVHDEKYNRGALGSSCCWVSVGHSDMQTLSEERSWWVTDKIQLPSHSIALACLQMVVAHLVLGKLDIRIPVSASHLLKAILELVLSPCIGFLASSVSAFQ